MGVYEKLGEWEFWKNYGDLIKEIDEKIVEPVLKELGITPKSKWRWDSNSIELGPVAASGYIQILIDIEEKNPVIMVYQRVHQNGTHKFVCEEKVVLPQDWKVFYRIGNLRKKLKKFLIKAISH